MTATNFRYRSISPVSKWISPLSVTRGLQNATTILEKLFGQFHLALSSKAQPRMMPRCERINSEPREEGHWKNRGVRVFRCGLCYEWTLSLPSSKSTFSQPFQREIYISDVVRIDSIIIYPLSKLWNAKFSIMCGVIVLVRVQEKFEVDHSWEWTG